MACSTSALIFTSPALSDSSTMARIILFILADVVFPSILAALCGTISSVISPALRASSRSWFIYAILSASNTALPSAVEG